MDNDLIEEELSPGHPQRPAPQGRRRRSRALGTWCRRRAAFAASEATIKVAVVTHGDTGSFWSVFKKGVDQAAKDLKAPRRERDAGLREQRRRRSRSPGSTPRSPRGAKVIATSVPDASALKDPLTKASAKGIEIITVNSGLGAFDSLPTYRSTSARRRTSPARAPASSSRRPGRRRSSIVIHEASNSGLQQRADGRQEDPRLEQASRC